MTTSSRNDVHKNNVQTSGIQRSKVQTHDSDEIASAEAWPIPILKEHIHYYLEDGFMVFTEAYHRARGTCCGNACRHCPFDHINVT